ncbi:MAG TPA: HAD-IA family hydrolase [Vicinamibacterales bacterium]|jgi:phosphoglycolate phosphatase
MLRLLVFDLDGTLVDSHRDLADATNTLLVELGGAPLAPETVASMVGDGAAVLVRRALTRAGLDPDTPGALDRFLAHYDERLLATTMPYDGMVETLDRLRPAYRLAVLTNKPSRATSRVLAGLGLADRFDGVIGGDTEHGRKPNPAGMLALVASAGVRPDETMLVGDSPIDLATARRAGVHVCLARYGFGYRFDAGDFDGTESFIDRPEDLMSEVARR